MHPTSKTTPVPPGPATATPSHAFHAQQMIQQNAYSQGDSGSGSVVDERSCLMVGRERVMGSDERVCARHGMPDDCPVEPARSTRSVLQQGRGQTSKIFRRDKNDTYGLFDRVNVAWYLNMHLLLYTKGLSAKIFRTTTPQSSRSRTQLDEGTPKTGGRKSSTTILNLLESHGRSVRPLVCGTENAWSVHGEDEEGPKYKEQKSAGESDWAQWRTEKKYAKENEKLAEEGEDVLRSRLHVVEDEFARLERCAARARRYLSSTSFRRIDRYEEAVQVTDGRSIANTELIHESSARVTITKPGHGIQDGINLPETYDASSYAT
ncbi:hypothetical protein DFH94DRAFT_684412 [Russula ochroleuca]|uniref:DNA topoisomerase I catalytic core eukaryotic-type domain-containing protein n=1 Tax=Russula ochroleuca TaxID=152965 RepID=A0A9P5JZR7_9AGAM|nr:hypothetical protein DFH94DRAFT_684412 [Russula ochroleuca]